ncbi:Translational activator Gcn1 [Gracilaria domingensis]|nr:Translational activator Gcn1 [Gracilaria domingensis]
MHDMISRVLSLFLSFANFEMLEASCRRSISALTSTVSRILKSVDDEIPGCLYGLEKGEDVSILEREDGAFTAAADALAFLTGTALSPAADALIQAYHGIVSRKSSAYHGIVSRKSSVRDAILASLTRLFPLPSSTIDCPRDASLGRALWLARFDPDDANAELSSELWENYNHPLNIHEDVLILMDLITRREPDVRLMAAKAIASAPHGKETEITRNECLLRIFDTYTAHLPAQREDTDSKTLSVKKRILPALKRG